MPMASLQSYVCACVSHGQTILICHWQNLSCFLKLYLFVLGHPFVVQPSLPFCHFEALLLPKRESKVFFLFLLLCLHLQINDIYIENAFYWIMIYSLKENNGNISVNSITAALSCTIPFS